MNVTKTLHFTPYFICYLKQKPNYQGIYDVHDLKFIQILRSE